MKNCKLNSIFKVFFLISNFQFLLNFKFLFQTEFQMFLFHLLIIVVDKSMDIKIYKT